ncbi:vacuolar amino acid transporter YPQ3-like protein 2 [Colletotrichum musicola]|uniref:Vacuolar amino acid transporter YPQ3-like protein 2 n=1 Tax=Colletotrichum musicola TaxID=2175873 RepID=A0A8H6KNF7_9PEZI|nr:vacuolar amino acid transporter YPQ3-like protein 2 [Colletotrichum musicola]
MAPPTEPLNLDVEAISGICGSISIACWVVVFSPQILENFRRSSADGLSLQFIIVWLAGDVFNILGAVLQGVLPTMIILAIYYTIADMVLLAQCFYYRGFTWKDEVVPPTPKPRNRTGEPNERTGLLPSAVFDRERRGSDWSNLSPAVPMLHEAAPTARPKPPTALQAIAWNTTAVLMVCAAGVLGWFLSRKYSHADEPGHDSSDGDALTFNTLGQIFGWLCAVLYLGSRLPQLLLNYRRKSTEGVSMLFFLFACLGNLTYVLSIFAFDPRCANKECAPGEASAIYGQYILVNLSWLAGSLGTLLLDMGIFAQYFMYRTDDESSDEEEGDEQSIDEDQWDQRPLLARADSTYA